MISWILRKILQWQVRKTEKAVADRDAAIAELRKLAWNYAPYLAEIERAAALLATVKAGEEGSDELLAEVVAALEAATTHLVE